MRFTEQFEVQPIPYHSRRVLASMPMEVQVRQQLLEAIKVQQDLLTATIAKQEFHVTRNGKALKPRAFWIETPLGVAFVPRFGNRFLFEQGQGIMVPDLASIAGIMTAFAEAVAAGEFDQQLVAIKKAHRRSGSEDAGSVDVLSVPEDKAGKPARGKRR